MTVKKQEFSLAGQGLLTVKEVASYLGFSVCKVYRLVESHQIPFIRLGKSDIRFRLADIDAWLANRETVPALDPIIESSLNVELALEKYDKLYLKGDKSVKSKGQKRWNYPFGSVYVRASRSGKEKWHIYYRVSTGKYVREAVKGANQQAGGVEGASEEGDRSLR